MEIRIPSQLPHFPIQSRLQNPTRHLVFPSSSSSSCYYLNRVSISIRATTFRTPRPACINPANEGIINDIDVQSGSSSSIPQNLDGGDFSSIWGQVKEIVRFAGPATGLWVCGPLMSLIDTAVIGQGSSLELAALGPGTVVCDYLSYVFMFLSIATSNMVATALARKDRNLVQRQISMLLFIAFICGLGMLFFTKFVGAQMIAAFTGPKNLHMAPAANTYVQIRGFAWPALLVGMVAQSASLGMKDSWGPLKALVVASVVNGFGDILLCTVLGYGIAGAAWATMVSQVMIGVFCMCTVWGEPLSQTAQSFMPEFIYGVHRNLMKARMLLRSLLIIGACTGLVLGTIGTSVPMFLPYAFTSDHAVVGEMHKVLLPYFLALIGTPSTHSLEGTLLAGRDLRFLSISMGGCFIFGGLLLLLMSSVGLGLSSCWWALVGFQWARFSLASMRLSSPHGMMYSEKFNQHEIKRLKAA